MEASIGTNRERASVSPDGVKLSGHGRRQAHRRGIDPGLTTRHGIGKRQTAHRASVLGACGSHSRCWSASWGGAIRSAQGRASRYDGRNQLTRLDNWTLPMWLKARSTPRIPILGRPGELDGRGDRIRTCDILLPKQARYQTALLPDASALSGLSRVPSIGDQ